MNNRLAQLSKTPVIQPGTQDKVNKPWADFFHSPSFSSLSVVGLQIFANNAAALAGGLSVGQLYRTGADPDAVCVVH